MKRYELKVKFGKNKVILHKIFEFSAEHQETFIQIIIERNDPNCMIYDELENVLLVVFGTKWYRKEYPGIEIGHCLQDRSLKEIAQKHPDVLVAAAIQARCYDWFDSSFGEFSIPCTSEDTKINISQDYSWVCKILKD